jgi:hypothetical protein
VTSHNKTQTTTTTTTSKFVNINGQTVKTKPCKYCRVTMIALFDKGNPIEIDSMIEHTKKRCFNIQRSMCKLDDVANITSLYNSGKVFRDRIT